jgi:hypothetical protein
MKRFFVRDHIGLGAFWRRHGRDEFGTITGRGGEGEGEGNDQIKFYQMVVGQFASQVLGSTIAPMGLHVELCRDKMLDTRI